MQPQNMQPMFLPGVESGAKPGPYRDLIRKLPKRHIFIRRATRRLRAEAQAGADRVILAREGRYDLKWLMIES